MSYLNALIKNIPVEELESNNTTEETQTPEEKPVSNDKKQRVFKKSSKKVSKNFNNKNSLRRKKTSDKGKTFQKDKNFIKVLNLVQEKFLLNILPDSKTADQIENSKTYMKNWSVPVYINVTEDILKTFDEKEYTFSKKRILESRYFQNMVRELYETKFGTTNIQFHSNRKDPTYFIIRVRG